MLRCRSGLELKNLPHPDALEPGSSGTLVKVVVDKFSQQGGGSRLNQILTKGPDKFIKKTGCGHYELPRWKSQC